MTESMSDETVLSSRAGDVLSCCIWPREQPVSHGTCVHGGDKSGFKKGGWVFSWSHGPDEILEL